MVWCGMLLRRTRQSLPPRFTISRASHCACHWPHDRSSPSSVEARSTFANAY
ncbi:hypothetical protein HMPREF3231_01989 [Bifidobacterium longum]|nr:hypothetical protein HMPREF3231_01989 [Bifidobacterium longum]